ncbi:DUF1659 domain-containing protein [Clostridium formicaceticum]|uniref:DUF1659 domain-containing protein n=1 Tax=Clostridium formicaceticum TaxID=1497 RepID=A0AAC9RN27_9CLOT|nr:DUF1659 domain-containing protein [Clostridium formicaceticum]AOY74689.1 hypothetical protein BJL90_01195 [Clostridium formicaceticum]ARE89066.1 hypothetical protein CLFO_34720 [Clostridium formicaceticum]
MARKLNETRTASARFITATDPISGSHSYMTRSIANFKTDAPIETVYNVAGTIGLLYAYTLQKIFMAERCELVED